jgi:hypothetical protein
VHPLELSLPAPLSPLTFFQLCGHHPDELIPSIPVVRLLIGQSLRGRRSWSVLPRCLPLVCQLPISYGDAEPLLRALGGGAAPESFQGGLNLTYRLGPTEPGVTVRVKVGGRPGGLAVLVVLLSLKPHAPQHPPGGQHHADWAHPERGCYSQRSQLWNGRR